MMLILARWFGKPIGLHDGVFSCFWTKYCNNQKRSHFGSASHVVTMAHVHLSSFHHQAIQFDADPHCERISSALSSLNHFLALPHCHASPSLCLEASLDEIPS
jgi:hypothetical protein